MTLTDTVTQRIITKLIKGQDYRIEIVTLIDAEFLQYVIDFFKRIVDAKLKNQNVTIDWYKKELLNPDLPSGDIAINSGLNEKTIKNMYNSATKEIVLEASLEHYDTLYKSINDLIENDDDINITLTIKLRGGQRRTQYQRESYSYQHDCGEASCSTGRLMEHGRQTG